jgi:isopentenyldiphosphate isomerase
VETTDNPDEVFDLVDEDDVVIGQASRAVCNVSPDLIHRAVLSWCITQQGRSSGSAVA